MKMVTKNRLRSIRKGEGAASPAISTVIITAATICLVLVAGTYANQVLESQQASSEFDTVQKSILAFDDAVRDIAWERGGSRSIRLTTNYGDVRLLPSNKSFEIKMSGVSEPQTISTAVVKYYMPSAYFTLGNRHPIYILGDNRSVVSSLSDSFGQALIKQERDFSSIAFNYRVRALPEGPSITVGSKSISYVDIMVIRLNCINFSVAYGDFELVAKNVGLTTESFGPCNSTGTIIVVSEGIHESIHLDLDGDQVMYNLIIADVQVST